MAPGDEGLGWAVGVDGPEAEVGQDLLDDRGLVNGRALIAEPESQCIAKVTKVATSRLKTSRLTASLLILWARYDPGCEPGWNSALEYYGRQVPRKGQASRYLLQGVTSQEIFRASPQPRKER